MQRRLCYKTCTDFVGLSGRRDFSSDAYLLTDSFLLKIGSPHLLLSFFLKDWCGIAHVAIGPIELYLLNGPNVDYFALRNRRSSGLRFLAFLYICLLSHFTAFLVLAFALSDQLIVHFVETEQLTLVLHEFFAECASRIEFSPCIDEEEPIVLLLLYLPHNEILNDLRSWNSELS